MSDTATLAVELTALERRIVAFEGRWFARRSDKIAAITRVFGMRETRYYLTLHRLLATKLALALAVDPVTVNRLCRQRDAVRAKRRRWLA